MKSTSSPSPAKVRVPKGYRRLRDPDRVRITDKFLYSSGRVVRVRKGDVKCYGVGGYFKYLPSQEDLLPGCGYIRRLPAKGANKGGK